MPKESSTNAGLEGQTHKITNGSEKQVGVELSAAQSEPVGVPPTGETLARPAGAKPRSRLAVAKDCTDVLSKAVPLTAGTVYLAGYFVTAGRLADYGVSITRLVDAQYFMAGLPLSILIWVTLVVGYSAFRYEPQRDQGNTRHLVGYVFVALFFVALTIEAVAMVSHSRFLDRGRAFDLCVMTLLRGALGQAGLWYFISGLRSGLFSQLGTYLRNRGEAFQPFFFALYVIAIAAVSLYGTYGATKRVYTAIPQAYGGGRPMRVQFYGERETIPKEMLLSSPESAEKGLTLTIPLDLIFQTSDTFIVESVGNGERRVWTLDARAIHGVLFNP